MQAAQIGYNPEYAEEAPSFEEISALKGDAVLEFGAPWCGHCQASHGALNRVMNNHSQLMHIKIFDGKGKRLGRQFGVKLWPTLILLRDGQEIDRIIRFTDEKDVSEFLAQTRG